MDGTNFNGNGYFVFSLHDTNGVILWSSGDFPVVGSTNLPIATWRLSVRDGFYQTRLGDTSASMPALDAARLRAAGAPFLRVWFNDGRHGWRPAGGDTPLKAALDQAAAGNNAISGAQADAMLREIRELRALVQKQQTPAPPPSPEAPRIVTVPLGDSPSLGRTDAPLVLVEFTDFQCHFCRRAHDEVLAVLQKKFVDTGRLRLVSRNLPLPSHPNAVLAAHAALCANAQQQFWPMRDRLFAMSTALSTSNILAAAVELSLAAKAFNDCLAPKPFAPQIARDTQDAAAAGITATPTFVLGRMKDGKVTGTLMVGAKPLPLFEAEIEKLLAAKPGVSVAQ